jgi:hypothetical protein
MLYYVYTPIPLSLAMYYYVVFAKCQSYTNYVLIWCSYLVFINNLFIVCFQQPGDFEWIHNQYIYKETQNKYHYMQIQS